MGRYEEAYPLEKRTVGIRKGAKDLAGYGSSLNRLGLLEMELGRSGEAQNTLSQAVDFFEKKEGSRCLALVEPLQTRADLFIHLKKWEGAQKDLEKILEIDTVFYTGFGVQTAEALRALGDYFTLRKLSNKSKPHYEQALEIYLKLLVGNKGYPALVLMERTAAVYRGLGKYSDALDWDSKSLVVEKEVYGQGHPRTALCEARIARDEQLLGMSQKAKAHLEEAEKTLRAALGDSHPLLQQMNHAESK
jgi:tetratricopeptide (TPR) repeat protein